MQRECVLRMFVLLDLATPELDGLEIAQRLREQSPLNGKPPFIVVISGNGKIRQHCRESGIDLLCVKPFNPMILLKAAEGCHSKHGISPPCL
jgi:CheY-like chemotaxis protein